MTEEELTAAVHWLMDVRDPDIKLAATATAANRGYPDIIMWAKHDPEAVYQLYTALVDLADQAPLDDTISFTAPAGKDR